MAFGTTVNAPPDLSTVANSTAAQTSNLRNPVAFFDFNGAGSYVLRLRASDGALETTRDITVTVTAQAASAPSIGPFANRVMKLGETLSLGLAGQDANASDHLAYRLIVSPSGAALTPNGSPRFSFTPTAAQLGVQNATIEVRDLANQTAQASFTITVQSANRPSAAFSREP